MEKIKKYDGMYDGYTDKGLTHCIMKEIYGRAYKKEKETLHFEFRLWGLSFSELVEEYKMFCKLTREKQKWE